MCLHYLQFVIKTLIFIDYVDYFNKLATSVWFNYDLAQEFMDIFDSGFFSSFNIHTQCKTVGTQSGALALWAFDSTLISFVQGGFIRL